jgi:diacylglycerol kinase (ATP)
MSATKFRLSDRMKSFKYAFNGILILFKSQHNAWIHLLASMAVIFLSFYYQLSSTEWCFILISIALVLSLEAVNTSIEYLTDIISPEKNEKAGKVKDLAAGAVLIAALMALTIALIVFIPKV